jgi:hypothetical protein
MKSDNLNIIRWVEPQGRTMDEIHRSTDTGFCNRIFYWEGLQLLNKLNGYEYQIEVDSKYWPELNELVELPNTKTTDYELDLSYTPITDSLIEDISIKDEFKLSEPNYYSNFDYQTLSKFNSILDENRPITDIKLKDSELSDHIIDFAKDMIGIHIRRGRGIIYGKSEIESLPKSIQYPYVKFRELEGVDTPKYYIYEFVKDFTYFNIIDSILNVNPKQKIYISYDVPDKLIDYYEQRYRGVIFTKKYFYDFIKNRYTTKDTHVKNVIDLFCLANTKSIIKHPLSTWSEFAQHHKPKPAVFSTEELSDIIDTIKIV